MDIYRNSGKERDRETERRRQRESKMNRETELDRERERATKNSLPFNILLPHLSTLRFV